MSRKIAVFVSGNGSNLQAIIGAIDKGELNARIAVVVSDNPGAHALIRAEQYRIPTIIIPPQACETRDTHSARIAKALLAYRPSLICLAGFMRIIGKPLLEVYPGRIINIHPALLPAYPGINAITRAFADRVPETGCTVHYVDAGVDTGPVIAQSRVPVLPSDNVTSLTERIHAAEHLLYPATIQKILDQLGVSQP